MTSHAVRWMFHSTAMVPSYELAVERLGAIAGSRVLEYGESRQQGIGRRGGMTWVGDNAIEIGQPIVEGDGAARFVARHGGGMHSVALQVKSLDATLMHLDRLGVRVTARPLPEMCFTDPRDTGGVFLQWSSFELGVDPRFGAPLPTLSSEPLLTVVHQAYVGALVDDPLSCARTLARLLSTSVSFEEPAAPPGTPAAGVSLGDCILALYPLPRSDDSEESESLRLWGRRYVRARTHLVALMVKDLGRAAEVVEEVGVHVVRADRDIVVLDPASTGGIQLALVGQLLPGDPRSEALPLRPTPR
jgi:hypothetical protein